MDTSITDINSRKVKNISFTAVKYFFLLLVSLVFLFPIYIMVINSFVPTDKLQYVAGTLVPKYFSLEPYTKVFTPEYLSYFLNTFKVCLLNIGGICLASSLTAYALAKLNFTGKNIVFAAIMGIILLPGTVISIPLYIIYSKLNWTGTLYPLWVPMWFGVGTMNIFLVRQFMRGIPKSYTESAQLDGANSFQIYLLIVLPLIKPVLIYLAVTGFIGNWNDFQAPLMYVRDNPEKWTLALALYQNFGTNASSTSTTNLPNIQMAAGVMMMIPCLILFSFFQRQIMEGISVVGIKG